MVEIFAEFTTTFFFLVGLVLIGIIFEKQFIDLEDKFDAWVASKRNAHKKAVPQQNKTVRVKTASRPAKNNDDKYHGFAA